MGLLPPSNGVRLWLSAFATFSALAGVILLLLLIARGDEAEEWLLQCLAR